MPTHPTDPCGPDWAARLYDERAAEMVLYGRALGLGHAEAEDVLHDAFRALLALESPPRQPQSYLVRAFRNRALNHRRSLFRRIVREFESRRWFEADASPTPSEDHAMEALADLPPDQREVIVLKIWHAMTFESIGDVLGISPNTAAGRYRYGLQKLRSRMTPTNDVPHEIDQAPRNDPAWLGAAKTVPEA